MNSLVNFSINWDQKRHSNPNLPISIHYVTIYGGSGDLAEFEKKLYTDYDFPPPLYLGGK